jgi:hypothetical protein
MFFDDHNPPHFHALYGEYEVLINITSFAVFAGNLPPRALGLVIEWATQHQDELLINWERARGQESLSKIEPLK